MIRVDEEPELAAPWLMAPAPAGAGAGRGVGGIWYLCGGVRGGGSPPAPGTCTKQKSYLERLRRGLEVDDAGSLQPFMRISSNMDQAWRPWTARTSTAYREAGKSSLGRPRLVFKFLFFSFALMFPDFLVVLSGV